MVLSNIKSRRKDSGFTIVELLVVIVVIGILAAITVVSYTGITTKAKGAQAQANANSIQQVAETYNADAGYYPATVAAFASGFGTSPTAVKPSGITVIGGQTGLAGAYTTPLTDPISAANGQTNISWACSPNCTVGSTTGGRIEYWDFQNSVKVIVYVGKATSLSDFVAAS
jgi:prepilin-type N-terminal cleavage/methylation domain-containing protein